MSNIGALTLARPKSDRPVEWSVVRVLEPGDLDALQVHTPASFRTPVQLKTIRSAHHNLAQLIARGEPSHAISLATGYSASYISSLQHEPAFRELVHYYALEREQVFIDLVEREKALAVGTLEELQHRLESEPEKWTKRELMELYDRLRPASGKVGGSFAQAAQPVAVQVNFVSAKPLGPTIELSARRD